MVRYAAERRNAVEGPVEYCTYGPKLPDCRNHKYLTHGQLLRLADEIGDYRAVVLLMGYCGLRWGEVRALRVSDIDLLHNRVTVARAAVEVNGGIVYDSPKSHAVRTVVPPPSLRADIEPWMAGKAPTALLFTAPEGGSLWTSNFCKRQLDQAAKCAGLRITPHDLRHTAASLAISSGANVLAVQRMLGHASAAMTLDTYAGLFDSDLEAVAGRLDEGDFRIACGLGADYRSNPAHPCHRRRSRECRLTRPFDL